MVGWLPHLSFSDLLSGAQPASPCRQNLRLYVIVSGVKKMDWGSEDFFWGIDKSFWGENLLFGGILANTWAAGHLCQDMIIFYIAVFKLALAMGQVFWGCPKSLWGG